MRGPVLAADERSQRPRSAPAAAAARADDLEKLDRGGHALEFARALLLGDKEPSHLPLDVQGDEHRPRLGGRLHACSDIRRVAEHFAGRLHDDRAGLDPDARLELRRAPGRVPGVEFGKRPLDRERRPNGALGVVLLRARIAEKRHQPVAEPLQHMAAEIGHCLRRLVEIGVDEVAPVFGVELRDKVRRADEVEEQDGDRTALGGNFRTVGRPGLGRRRGNVYGSCAGQSGDCIKQPAPIANRGDADVFQVIGRQLRQHVCIDLIFSKLSLVFTEAETAEPPADIHRRASHGLTG